MEEETVHGCAWCGRTLDSSSPSSRPVEIVPGKIICKSCSYPPKSRYSND